LLGPRIKLNLTIQRLIPLETMHSATRQIGGLEPRSALGAVVGVCRNTGGDIQLVGTCISEIEVSRKPTTILPVIMRPSYGALKLYQIKNAFEISVEDI
jgi:hypothetical protein